MNDPISNAQLNRMFARLRAAQAAYDTKLDGCDASTDFAHELHAITACEQAIDRWYDSHSPSEVLP